MNALHNCFKFIIFITVLYLKYNECHAKIMRNNALMTKMVSHFQNDNNLSNEPRSEYSEPSKKVMTLMQKTLCRNFPTIPCEMIAEDATLNKLIDKSIQQINNKKMSMESATPTQNYRVTLFPVVNSEDLSSFLQVQETGFFDNTKRNDVVSRKNENKQKHGATKQPLMKYWSLEKQPKNLNIMKTKIDAKSTSGYNGRKKIRKFYPHKTKYKEKYSKNARKDIKDYSEEKVSMSVEVPDVLGGKRHLAYKVEPADPSVWRIEYMKHEEPSLNMFGYETDQLKGKIIKSGPNVIVDENVLERAARKDILHPDVYIKKNVIRKSVVDLNSEALD